MDSFQAARIERADAADLVEIAGLFDAYRRFFAGKSDLQESQRFLAERFARADSAMFVARRDRRIDGFIQLYPLWSSWYCKRIWFLSDLYVTEERRGRGLGHKLVECAIAHARETDATSIMVELPLREPHLRGFYGGLGFHEDAVFDLARHVIG